jgi:hypothetical protein
MAENIFAKAMRNVQGHFSGRFGKSRELQYVFQTIAQRGAKLGFRGPTTTEARDWFRSQAMMTVGLQPQTLVAQSKLATVQNVTRANIGECLFYCYDPKWKNDLPYYDIFPMIFVIDATPTHFLGMNLHYLPWQYRARLMDALHTITNNKKYDATTKLKSKYALLKGYSKFRYFQPCIKLYLKDHVKSKKYIINADMWDFAIQLPLQRFKKKNEKQVWQDSMSQIAKHALTIK